MVDMNDLLVCPAFPLREVPQVEPDLSRGWKDVEAGSGGPVLGLNTYCQSGVH